MAEYYEREALIDALMMYTWRDEEEASIDDADEKRAFIEEWLPNVPAADVRPVVHSFWGYNPGDNTPYCDNCGMPQDMPSDFCHSCGADMREAKNGV